MNEFSTAKKVMMNDLRMDENKEIDLHMPAMLNNCCYLFFQEGAVTNPAN